MAIKGTDKDHTLGLPDAAIELVIYSDFECPYCLKAYWVTKDIMKELEGSIRLVFRHFPLSDIHPHALHAAVASEIAAAQGKFWEMHDLLFENQEFLDDSYLLQYAKIIGLDTYQFEKDFDDDRFYKIVEEDYETGEENGVQGTPTFFVNGMKYEGDWTGTGLTEYLKLIVG